MGIKLNYLHLTFSHSKGQGQGQVHIDNGYLGNWDGYEKHWYCHKKWCLVLYFDLHVYIWSLSLLKVKVTVTHISTANVLKMVKYMANVAIVIKYEVTYEFSIRTFTFDLHRIFAKLSFKWDWIRIISVTSTLSGQLHYYKKVEKWNFKTSVLLNRNKQLLARSNVKKDRNYCCYSNFNTSYTGMAD